MDNRGCHAKTKKLVRSGKDPGVSLKATLTWCQERHHSQSGTSLLPCSSSQLTQWMPASQRSQTRHHSQTCKKKKVRISTANNASARRRGFKCITLKGRPQFHKITMLKCVVGVWSFSFLYAIHRHTVPLSLDMPPSTDDATIHRRCHHPQAMPPSTDDVNIHGHATIHRYASTGPDAGSYPGEAEAHADGGVDGHAEVTLVLLHVQRVFGGNTHGRGQTEERSQQHSSEKRRGSHHHSTAYSRTDDGKYDRKRLNNKTRTFHHGFDPIQRCVHTEWYVCWQAFL